MDFCGKVAIVTGATSGIGEETARQLMAKGAQVLAVGRSAEKGAELEKLGAKFYACDLSDPEQIEALCARIARDYPKVDILINNAGTQNGNDIDVNLKGTISITEHYGIHPDIYSIVMIGSASGHTGSEFPEYAASKGGVLAYAKNVAMRVAPYQATCNSLDFGGVMTELNRPVMEDKKLWEQIMDLTPLKRWMTVEEAAEWIYFISVKNRFCTGQNILIDGLEAGNCNFIWPDET